MPAADHHARVRARRNWHLHRRTVGHGRLSRDCPVLASWPVERPRNWPQVVNQPQTPQEEEAIRTSIARGRPFGRPVWQKRTAQRLGLELTLRPRGRPLKARGKRADKRFLMGDWCVPAGHDNQTDENRGAYQRR
jgi:hypothetical protein